MTELIKKNALHEAKLYDAFDDQSVVCNACKFYCKIKPDKIGICGVRVNRNGKLYTLVYGKASAVHVDPVEKKPLYHFLPGTEIFSMGTVGCNFGCSFCQNWDISQVTRDLRKKLMKEKRPWDLELEMTEHGYALSPGQIVSICRAQKIQSIAFTYNEPVIFFEYLYDTAVLAHEHGIRSVFVSNGYESDEAMALMRPYLSAMNIDLKSFSNTFYTKLCKAKLEPVLETIRHAKDMGIWIEITTLIIPGQNDSDMELTHIAEFIASVSPDIPWHISAFYPQYQMMEIPRTPSATLRKAYDIGIKSGLKFIYVGNIIDDERSNTYCSGCGKVLISRSGYGTTVHKIFRNRSCTHCQTKIPGIWN
jgi:pyruvate formate lyase activating enzyme